MTVHVIIPVHNRMALTKSLVACLRAQILNEPLRMLIVNDGSTDGTAEWLSAQGDIDVLDADGSLFWGGAVDLALCHLEPRVMPEDWVLLMNNDTTIAASFIQRLLDVAKANAPAAVGSVIRDEADHACLLSIGAHVDAWRIFVTDLLTKEMRAPPTERVFEVDVLSGRGVIFPIASLVAAGGMRPRVLPHYLADYELSVRVRKRGWRLLIDTGAAVFSNREYGSLKRMSSWRDKMFSVRSPKYLPAFLAFWWAASNWPQRLTMPLRLPLLFLLPRLRKPTA